MENQKDKPQHCSEETKNNTLELPNWGILKYPVLPDVKSTGQIKYLHIKTIKAFFVKNNLCILC